MIRKATTGDSRILAEMAVQMWDSHTADELEADFITTLHSEKSALFASKKESRIQENII